MVVSGVVRSKAWHGHDKGKRRSVPALGAQGKYLQ